MYFTELSCTAVYDLNLICHEHYFKWNYSGVREQNRAKS